MGESETSGADHQDGHVPTHEQQPATQRQSSVAPPPPSSESGQRADASAELGEGTLSAAEKVIDRPWWQRKGVLVTAGIVVAFLVGLLVGPGGDTTELEAQAAVLSSEVGGLEEEREQLAGSLEQLTADLELRDADSSALENELEAALTQAEGLEKELAEAQRELRAVPDVADLEERISELEEALDDSEKRALATAELEAREEAVAQAEASQARQREAASEPETAAPPTPASGCASGQVDINSASAADLQQIHQVGPARAEQILSLRPFRSVDDLTRVSGIGPAHLAAIKGQGLACVP